MDGPEGGLTELQLAVLDQIWAGGRDGREAAAVCRAMEASRQLARTTVLTLLQRLEQRGWLERLPGRPLGYRAVRARSEVERDLAGQFVRGFFGGSPTRLLSSLLGSEQLSPDELTRLRRLLEAQSESERPNTELPPKGRTEP